MKTSTTTTTTDQKATPRKHGWLWFILLWAVGVMGSFTIGYAFKILLKLTLLAAK